MKLHFLGTTGYHPNNLRQTACLMLPEIGVIFDAGTGIFRSRDLIQTSELHIYLSHTHLDHVIGLTFLFDILFEKDAKVKVHVAGEKIEAIEKHLMHPDLFPVSPAFEIVPFSGKPETLPDGSTISMFPLQHPGGCTGFRVDWPNHSLAYVTDTIADENADYIDKIRGVKTLVHECYFPDGYEAKAKLTGHSCLTPVVQVASKAEVESLYLVHINPLDETGEKLDLNAAREIFAETHITHDQQTIDI